MPVGYTVRVTTPGNGGASMQEFFHVAIEDKNRAQEAVRIAAKLASSVPVEVIGELSTSEALSLEPEEVRSVRRTIARPERQVRGHRW
jgi:hypothetical protein